MADINDYARVLIGSRRPGRPCRAFRLAYFDARPVAGIQAVYDGRCPR